ncbi:ABC transporter substrate binding protein [Desulfobacter sp.]|uniref:ABC transporter substrate binding protein n=1 Tax=Desulfobacter sp. TaxID=2294 RepID=UPI003D0C7688
MLVWVALIFVPVAHAKSIQIGILYDGDSAQSARLKSIFVKELQSITNDRFKLSFPAGSSLSGGWNTEQINQAFDRLMASDKVDMILVLGNVSSYEVCKRSNFTKPIFAANAVIPKLKVISSDSGKSGIYNLNYLNAMRNPDRKFQLLFKMAPVKQIAVIVDGFTMASIPELNELIHSIAKAHNLDAEIVTVNESAREAAAKISGNTDAVLIGSLPRLTDDEFQKLAKNLIARKLPSYSCQGPYDVEMGIMISTVPKNHQVCLARTVAANILEVLNGADPGQMPTVFTSEEKVTINMATVRAIGIAPYWDLLTGAELISDGTGNVERRLNITMVMEEALAANPDLAAGNQSVEAGIAKVKEARSSLLPQIDVNTRTALVDGDRALAYSGMLPERRWTVAGKFAKAGSSFPKKQKRGCGIEQTVGSFWTSEMFRNDHHGRAGF